MDANAAQASKAATGEPRPQSQRARFLCGADFIATVFAGSASAAAAASASTKAVQVSKRFSGDLLNAR